MLVHTRSRLPRLRHAVRITELITEHRTRVVDATQVAAPDGAVLLEDLNLRTGLAGIVDTCPDVPGLSSITHSVDRAATDAGVVLEVVESDRLRLAARHAI